MTPQISVIIPVYNMAQYLPRCINSVLGQTFMDLELLLVDDGSKDASGKICDEYAQNDSRITVVHKENGGVGSARNAGLDRAKGKWITFVDADDVAERNLLESLLPLSPFDGDISTIMGNNRCNELTGEKEKIDMLYGQDCLLNTNSLLRNTDFFLSQSASLYSKIYDRKVIDEYHIRFLEKTSIYEDCIFNIEYFSHVEIIRYKNEVQYCYMIYPGTSSLTRSLRPFTEYEETARKILPLIEMVCDNSSIEEVTRKRVAHMFAERLFSGVFSLYGDNKIPKQERISAMINYISVLRPYLLQTESWSLKNSAYRTMCSKLIPVILKDVLIRVWMKK